MNDRNGAFVLFWLATVSLAACGGELGGTRGAVFDTVAGIPSVLNSDRGMVREVEWTLTEHLTIGAGQQYDGLTVTFALDVGITPGGGVAVLDAGNRRVLLFDAAGEFVRALGGVGQLQVPILLETADSVIYVFDARERRMVMYRVDGQRLGRFEPDFHGLVATTPNYAAGAPGEIYTYAEPLPFIASSRDTGSAVLYRLDGTGALVDTVLRFPASNWSPLRLPSGRTTYAKPRMLPEPKYSAIPGQLAVSATASYVIDIRRADGEVVRRIVRAYDAVPVNLAIQDSVLDRLSQGPQGLPRDLLKTVPFAPIVPAIEDLALDDQGRLWVDPYDQEGPTRIDIFEADGSFLGPLYLPRKLRLEDIRGDLACGAFSQADGESAVTCYRITE